MVRVGVCGAPVLFWLAFSTGFVGEGDSCFGAIYATPCHAEELTILPAQETRITTHSSDRTGRSYEIVAEICAAKNPE